MLCAICWLPMPKLVSKNCSDYGRVCPSEGGKPLPPRFMEELRALTHEFGCYLIADEVQIAGRSGHIFHMSLVASRLILLRWQKAYLAVFRSGQFGH